MAAAVKFTDDTWFANRLYAYDRDPVCARLAKELHAAMGKSGAAPLLSGVEAALRGVWELGFDSGVDAERGSE
jgi:hypothetical protein